MKQINILVVEESDIPKLKELIKLFDKLTEWSFNNHTYEVFDISKGEMVKAQVWTCLGEGDDFMSFLKAYDGITDNEIGVADVEEALKVL